MFWTLLRLDARQLVRERLAIVVLIVGLISAGVAAATGSAWISRLSGERAAFLDAATKDKSKLRTEIGSAETSDEDRVGFATRIARGVAFPVPVLADFSIGRSDIEPATATLRMRYRSDTLFRVYQIDNAERLMRGRLDLAFLAVVIAPLLLIALGYGVFASDRERGTARLLVSQAGSPIRLLLARGVNRLGLVVAPLLVAGLALLAFGPALEGRIGAAVIWLVIAMLGLLFWWSVILLVNSLKVTAESAALALVGLWALLVFVAPAAINAGAQAAYPPPSRLGQIVDARKTELAAAAAYENDHTSLGRTSLEKRREGIAKNYRIGLAIEREVGPRAAAFDAQLRRQQETVRTVQLVSPPMVTAAALASVAGTDSGSYAVLRDGARGALARFKRSLAEVVEQGRPFDLAFDAGVSGFSPTAAVRNVSPFAIVYLVLVMLVVAGTAIVGLRKPTL